MLWWLAACTAEPPLPAGDVLPQRADGVVLLAAIEGNRVDVEGAVRSELYVDLDGPSDDRYGFRYAVRAEGRTLYSRTTSGPVLVRDFLDYWSGVSGVDILPSLPTLGHFPVIVPMLEGADEVVFELRNEEGAYQHAGRYALSRLDLDDRGLSDLVLGTETLHRSGPSNNRLDIAILGDGYTDAQLGDFQAHARDVTDALLAIEPYASYADYVNIHRVDVVSQESGASYDCVDSCAPRDTAFDSIFAIELVNLLAGTDYSSRAIFQASQHEVARAAAWVPYDHVLVLVNTPTYGGMAVHVASATSQSVDWEATAIHELGHTVGLLGDEYVFDDCIRSESMGLPGNISASATEPPWTHWVDAGTRLPTPSDDAGVGTFEGAYNCDDLYRPQQDCMMRSDGDFCPVCSELLVRRFFRYADPVDEIVFDGRQVTLLGPRPGQSVDWSLDGEHAGTTTVRAGFKTRVKRGQRLEIRVREQTPLVREDHGDLEQLWAFDG